VRASLSRLYAAIAEVTGSRVVVDSSKLPGYADLLAATPGIDLRVLHLVRDPRAAAYSWSTPKQLHDGAARAQMERIGPAKSALLWDLWNGAAAGLRHRVQAGYLRLRYEDLVADQATALRRILELIGMADVPLPIGAAGELPLGVHHSVAGNPDRLRQRTVRLVRDDRWLAAQRPRHRRVVTVMTAPRLVRYGYPIRVPRPADQPGLSTATLYERAPEGEGRLGRLQRRVRRHLRWGRTQGFGRLVEEDELNPVTRAHGALTRWRWRRSHPQPPGAAVPVFLVGVQRSGTNMLARGLERAPELEVHNENDRRAFDHFLLRDDDRLRRIVLASGHSVVLFKPLCDSHRVDQLLDGLRTPSPPRAIWAYRDVDGRVRSALAKFGRNNLLVLRDIAGGRGAGMWQAGRLSAPILEVISAFDYESMTAETAAALFWWMRNGLFFEMGLDRRSDVMLASYTDLLARPRPAMNAICRFLDLEFRDEMVAHIAPRAPARSRPLDIDPRARMLCDALQERLDQALGEQRWRAA